MLPYAFFEQTHVVGYYAGDNPFLFDRGLNKHVAGMVSRYEVRYLM